MYTLICQQLGKKVKPWCYSWVDVVSGLKEVLVCRLTTQVVHLLLLQQADRIFVSLQHQLCLGVLACHSLAVEDFLGFEHHVVFCACQNNCGEEKGLNIARWPFELRSVYVTMLKCTQIPGYGPFMDKVLSAILLVIIAVSFDAFLSGNTELFCKYEMLQLLYSLTEQ